MKCDNRKHAALKVRNIIGNSRISAGEGEAPLYINSISHDFPKISYHFRRLPKIFKMLSGGKKNVSGVEHSKINFISPRSHYYPLFNIQWRPLEYFQH